MDLSAASLTWRSKHIAALVLAAMLKVRISTGYIK